MNPPNHLPRLTLDDYEGRFADRHRLHDVIDRWARIKPEAPALVSANDGQSLTWRDFSSTTKALAAELHRRGFAKGDYLLSLLPFTIEHVLLEYACFRLGVIVAPLDLRLTPPEILRAIELLNPRGFAGLGKTALADFSPLWKLLAAKAPQISTRILFGPVEDLDGLTPYADLLNSAKQAPADFRSDTVTPDDGALVIFTTGSTGSPKPALLSHRNITVQNMCLSESFFAGDSGRRTLVNLPASHVGGQTEILMSTLFGGGTAVLLAVFDAARSLHAIAQHKLQLIGQIPAMFNLEWLLKDYARHDLSSLEFVAYGGNAVSRVFVEKMATMAPLVGTGLGLTETAGFCTYIDASASRHEEILQSLGHAMPIYPCSIRQAMREDGSAGDELPAGEIGNVCFHGPQTFLGYVNDPEATARTISSDGFLYTGDLGRLTDAGLQMTGRAKWVIKSMGYQVFPGDVERCILALEQQVSNCIVVGAPHAVLSEAVVALVEKRPGITLTERELDKQTRALPSYMRPRHWILLEPGTLPLNRVVKPDHQRAQQIALDAISTLRANGQWDSDYLDK